MAARSNTFPDRRQSVWLTCCCSGFRARTIGKGQEPDLTIFFRGIGSVPIAKLGESTRPFARRRGPFDTARLRRYGETFGHAARKRAGGVKTLTSQRPPGFAVAETSNGGAFATA